MVSRFWGRSQGYTSMHLARYLSFWVCLRVYIVMHHFIKVFPLEPAGQTTGLGICKNTHPGTPSTSTERKRALQTTPAKSEQRPSQAYDNSGYTQPIYMVLGYVRHRYLSFIKINYMLEIKLQGFSSKKFVCIYCEWQFVRAVEGLGVVRFLVSLFVSLSVSIVPLGFDRLVFIVVRRYMVRIGSPHKVLGRYPCGR